MIEITLWMKVTIFILILVISYFVLKHFDMDPVMGFWEAITEIEWDLTALVLTFIFSSLVLAFIWKSPMWATPEIPYRLTQITGIPMKILMSILLPIISYPLAVRARNK